MSARQSRRLDSDPTQDYKILKSDSLIIRNDYNMQYSLTSLKTKTIISKAPGGVHTFESAAFERWVRTMAPVNT